jgi:succinate dehydrogenase/fumarate reductase-like Fe-S protein
MSDHPPEAQAPPTSRNALCDSLPGPVCGGCGRPLTGRQRVACSNRCRAWLSRRQQLAPLRQALLGLAAQVADLVTAVETLGVPRPRRRKRTP